jgi:hypothetical protein
MTIRAITSQLAEKIASVDWLCGLSSIQIQRLQLAGPEDIKRFFDRIDSLQS